MKKIGFIGTGNMGLAMIKGAMKIFAPESLTYTDANEERLKYVKSILNIPYSQSNKECVLNSDLIVLAVKPQYLQGVLQEIKGYVTSEKIFVSIAPGITIDAIKKELGDLKIIRVMPNTPAMISEGMSAICFSQDIYTEEERDLAISFIRSFSETIELSEKQMDAVVPISGSSPAYVYMMIEAMADAGVLFGIPRDVSYKLAAQSVYGSAKMVLETGEHPGVLKDAVCSPGGTTIEAVRKLEECGFRSAIIEAMKVCYDKTIFFNQQNNE